MVKFDVTKAEFRIIHEIATRAMRELVAARKNDPFKLMDIQMDITAVHANGNALQLTALRDADAFNFAHDVLGIRRKLDRETGQLTDNFSPRFSV
jgi:hypothetical protein